MTQAAYADILNEVIMDEAGDGVFFPERITPTRRDLLRAIVDFGRALHGRDWRAELDMRPFVEPERVWMRHAPEIEDGWYTGCDETAAGAEPFWKVV